MPDTAAPPDLSVVLINWNALEVTSAALASLRDRTTGITYEVFVVDNGTTKDAGIAELARRFPWVQAVANPENRGFTKANNQGLRAARGRYVLLLNNDTVQTENALGAAVAYMDTHPDVGALGILHRNADASRTVQPSAFDFPRPWRECLSLFGLGGRPLPPPSAEERDVDWVCGSFLLMRRLALEQVGPLDERFFIYDEDIDWCRRARRAGWRIRFWPGASMVHLGAAANPLMRDKTLVMFRSRLTYLRKHHGLAAAVEYYAGTGLRLALATTKQALRLVAGRATAADVRQRAVRLLNFVAIRPSQVGV